MAKYTGIYAKTMIKGDFNLDGFDGQAININVPVTMQYQVLPGQEVAFGAGSTSLNGVRSARVMQINPMNSANTAVPCMYRLIYADSNKVRQTVVREELTELVEASPSAAPNQSSYLPETAMRVGAYAFLIIQLTPLVTDSANTFSAENSSVVIPTTVYTLASASGN